VLNRDPAPLPKWTQPPIFGSCLLWPNGSLDQDATWYAGRPRLRRHCVRWGPSSAQLTKQKGAQPQFSAHVCCGQMAGLIKMPLGAEVGLVPGHILLDGDTAPPHRPNFRLMSIVAKRSPIDERPFDHKSTVDMSQLLLSTSYNCTSDSQYWCGQNRQ